jgi:hypothetical protein
MDPEREVEHLHDEHDKLRADFGALSERLAVVEANLAVVRSIAYGLMALLTIGVMGALLKVVLK